jgi:hypothetical protein
VQLITICKTFDGHDFGAIGLDGKHQTCAHRSAVEQNGTGTAYAVFASDVGSDQFQIVS